MTLGESLLVVSTLLGPVLAVQAQKWVERARAKADLRMWIFSTLLATRATKVAPEHVRALNMIELAFYGPRILNTLRRGKKTPRF